MAKGNDDDTIKTKQELQNLISQMRLKRTIVLFLVGLSPVLAVAAVIVAVMAMNGYQEMQEQLGQSVRKVDYLNASLVASAKELEKLKVVMAQEKAAHEEMRIAQEEQQVLLIQHISKLQLKLKISPTLEQQVRQAAASSAGMPAVPHESRERMVPLKDAIQKFNKK